MKLFGRSPGRAGAQSGDGPSVAMLTIRVAMAASAIVGLAYLVIAVVVAVVVTNNLTAEIDGRLDQALAPVPVQAGSNQPFGQAGSPDRPFGPPVLMWRASPDAPPVPGPPWLISPPASVAHVLPLRGVPLLQCRRRLSVTN